MAQLRFLAALGAGQPDALFFAADLGHGFSSSPSWGSRLVWTSAAPARRDGAAGVRPALQDARRGETASGHAAIGTMHLAKGLEFRAVAVMACDDEVIPLQERIETVGEDADLQEVYDTERHLLYVACTRPRDLLLITAVDPASEFLDDLVKCGRLPGLITPTDDFADATLQEMSSSARRVAGRGAAVHRESLRRSSERAVSGAADGLGRTH